MTLVDPHAALPAEPRSIILLLLLPDGGGAMCWPFAKVLGIHPATAT